MKNLFSLIMMMTLCVTATFAQEGGPTMDFESTTVDYGTIEQHSEPLRVFSFTNNGDEPLIIKNAKGSCGCTVPTYPKEPIMPGESGEIEVRYDTKRIGKFTKTVTLTTNQAVERIVLKIQGQVNAKPTEKATPEKEGNMMSNPNH